MGSSNRRFQPRSATSALATILDRLSQAFHRKFDVGGLQLVPALDLGLIALLGEALEIFGGQFPGGRALSGEFFAINGSLGIAPLKRKQWRTGNPPSVWAGAVRHYVCCSPPQVALVNGQTQRCNISSLLYFRRNKVPISA